MGVSRIKYYKNISTPRHPTWFSYYKNITFPTQIFRVLLLIRWNLKSSIEMPLTVIARTPELLFSFFSRSLKVCFLSTDM